MRNLIATFVKYPFYANLIIAVLLISGLFSMANMKKSFFPERQSRDIMVSVVYPGASPKEMEEGITTRIEESIRGIVGIKEVNSSSSENFSRVTITTTGEYDIDETLTEVKNSVDGISSFPTAAEKPVIFKQRNRTQVMYMGLSGDVDLYTLKKITSQIEDDILNSGVISNVQISGFPDLEISVEISEENLLRYRLTFDEILRAISLNNRDISGGLIKSSEEEILIRTRARSVKPNDIGEIILRAQDDGSFLRIRDVAEVKMQFADVASEFFMNGKQAVSFFISKLPEEDLELASNFLSDYVEKFNSQHSDIQLDITFDFLDMLRGRLDLLYSNGGLGLLLVIISLALFLSARLSFWVAWGIPASFLGMFTVAVMYGITINMISLFGMILVIGILVDDGIVIGENIFTHFERGKTPARAAIDGTMEVLPAVVTSIATTVIAFIPILLLEGRMEFLFEMAFVVIASLLFSMFEAFLVLPAHIASPHVLQKKKETHLIRKKLEAAVDFMKHKVYGRLLTKLIEWKWAVVVVPLAIVIITMGLFKGGLIQATFFPQIPFDSFNVEIAFKPGSGEKRTMEYLTKFEQQVWEVEKELEEKYNGRKFIRNIFRAVGNAFSGLEVGSHAGNLKIFMEDMEGAPISSFGVAKLVKKKIGEPKELEKMKVGGRNHFGSPVSISLLGRDLEEISHAKVFLENGLKKFTELQNISDNNAPGKQEIRLKFKPKAYFLGLDRNSISSQVRQAFFGGQAQRLQKGKDEIRVWVRYPKRNRMTIGQLEQMKIKTPRGEFPLSELATYTIERGAVNIKRFNGSREVRIEADLADPYDPIPPILERVENEILTPLRAKFSGVRIEYQGQQRSSAESSAEIQKYFGIAFLVMILLLVIHFGSVSQALIIILMIPLAWIGAAWGHGLEGKPISMLSAWGMVALSGVIINDAVVFLSKYNSNLLAGMKVPEAAHNAGVSRFRAIVLTTLTTTLGLYPLILEKSFQAQFLIPMAISLAYGVMIGTGFILLFFPIFIIVLNDLKVWIKWLWTGKKPSREEVEKVIINSKKSID